MKSPKMKGPSNAEMLAAEQQKGDIERRNRQLAEETARAAADKAADSAARSAGKVGMRSLMSGDWQGFQRGGDLGPKGVA